MTFYFPVKDPAEIVLVSFDFTQRLGTGDTIQSCVFSAIRTVDGTDESTSMISGVADLTRSPVVSQQVKGGVNDQEYLIEATATLASGLVVVGSAVLPVKLGGN